MSEIKCIAFDCFGTVFDMDGVSRNEIGDYVRHVRKNDFTPYRFPDSWRSLPLHPDAAEGVKLLQSAGYVCVTLSNGDASLLRHVSVCGGVYWDSVIDLAKHRVYKPHIDAYRTIEKETQFKPDECLMVTANPTFGDIEGSAAIGMLSQVIRQPEAPANIIELAWRLERNDE